MALCLAWISRCRSTTMDLPNQKVWTFENLKTPRSPSTIQKRIHQIRTFRHFKAPQFLLLNLHLVGRLPLQCQQHRMELFLYWSCPTQFTIFRIYRLDWKNFNLKISSLQRLPKRSFSTGAFYDHSKQEFRRKTKVKLIRFVCIFSSILTLFNPNETQLMK
jgi:hypothetical protein